MVGVGDVKIYKSIVSGLGGGISTTQVINGNFNNFFGNVTRSEQESGEDYYGCVFVANKHGSEAMDSFKFWLGTDTIPADTKVRWGFDNSPLTGYRWTPNFTSNGSNTDETADAAEFDLTVFTVAIWFKVIATPAVGAFYDFVNKGGYGSDSAGENLNYGISMNSNGTITAGFENAAGVDSSVTSPMATSYADGAWHFALCYYSGTSLQLFIDNMTTPIGTLATTATPETNAKPIRINQNSRASNGWMPSGGQLDEVRIWNRAMTDSAERTILMTDNTVNQTGLVFEKKFGADVSIPVPQTIPNVYTAPSNVTWFEANVRPTIPNVGRLLAQDAFPIWIWWHVEPGAVSRKDDACIFDFTFNIPGGGTGDPGSGGGGGGTLQVDQFGIRMIYPTLIGGRTYYSNWHLDSTTTHTWDSEEQIPGQLDPQDSMADLVAPSTCRATVDASNNWLLATTNSDRNSWRYYIKDPAATHASSPWKWSESMEITAYYYVVKENTGGSIRVHLRIMGPTEHWTAITDDNPDGCGAAGHEYSYEIKANGTNQFRKEVVHVGGDAGGYAENIIFPNTSVPTGKWVGMKLVTQLRDGKMRVQAWRDDTDGLNGGTWKLEQEITDDGTNWELPSQEAIDNYDSLPTGSGNCLKVSPMNAPLTMDCTAIGLRVDNHDVRIKKFSGREIDPASEGSGGSGGSSGGGTGGGSGSTTVTYAFESKFGSQGTGNGEFEDPHDITFNAAGEFYVCDRVRNDIQKFTHSGTYQSKFGSSGSGNGQFDVPYANQMTPNFDFLYVCDRGNNRVQKLTPTGTYVSKIETVNGQALDAPEDISFDKTNGDIYICDTGNDRVVKLNSAHGFILQWGTTGSGNGQFEHPHSINVAADRSVLVSCGDQPYIQKFTPNGVFIKKWGTEGTGQGQTQMFLEHMDIDVNQRVHLINNDSRPIINVWDTEGNWITQYGKTTSGSADGQFKEPEHVTCDAAGKPYVVDAKNFRIQIFSVSDTPTGGGGGTGGGGNPPPTPSDYKIAIVGDEGCTGATDDVIDLIQGSNYDYVISVGDHAYASSSCWTGRFGVFKPNFNSAYGNHEYDESGGISPYKTFFGHSLTYFSFKFQNILFVVADTNINCDIGSTQHNALKAQIEAAASDPNIKWRVAIMHHPWFGSSSDHGYNDFGQVEAFHQLFMQHKFAFVVTGHNHNWQRTKQVAYNSGNPESPTALSTSSPYVATTGGLIHVVSGTGGHDSGSGLYPTGSQPSFQAFQNRTHNGVWEIVATNNGLTWTCSFVETGGDKLDTFIITTT